jgi:hypothetical protein
MKTGIDIDGMHPPPRLVTDTEDVIRLAPGGGGAVDEVRHLTDGFARVRQQRSTCVGLREIADPRNGEFRFGRGGSSGRHGILVYIGEYGSHTLAHKGLRNCAADAVAGACNQRRVACGIEQVIEYAHCAVSFARLIFADKLADV